MRTTVVRVQEAHKRTMTNALKIKKTMQEQGIPDELISKFEFPDPKGNRPEPLIAFVDQMDKLLTPEQCLSVMEKQGCCKTGKNDAPTRAFGREHADKTIEEKVALYNKASIPYKVPCRLHDDGTLSVFWGAGQAGDYKCVCAAIKKLKQPENISLTYCGCCGGHVRYNLQNALDTGLRLKEVVSSPISSGGKKHCEFLFEILEDDSK